MINPAKAAPDVDWPALRGRFPAAAACTYLNTAGGGPLSDSARAAALDYYDAMHAQGDIGWPNWRQRVESVRKRVAGALNANSEDIAFFNNASTALNVAATLAPPGEVVCMSEEFPSVTLPWIARGRDVQFVETNARELVTAGDVESALSDKTSVVALSHVQYASGARLDVASIGALCRDRGLMFVCDATQSFGAFPVDVDAIRPSVLVFSGYKWTCAGYGIAVMYISKELRDWSAPPVAGWRSAMSPYQLEYRSPEFSREARALEMGHPPVPGIFALGGALDVAAPIGIDQVTGRIQGLVDRLHAGLDARGMKLASPWEKDARSGIVMIDIDNPERADRELKRNDVFISVRSGRLRVSLHFFNDESDVDRLLAVLDGLC